MFGVPADNVPLPTRRCLHAKKLNTNQASCANACKYQGKKTKKQIVVNQACIYTRELGPAKGRR